MIFLVFIALFKLSISPVDADVSTPLPFSGLKIAISSTPNNISPLFSTDANSQNIARLTHLSLIDFDQNMNPVCIACESFLEKTTDNGHILEFYLKKDLKFWNGDNLDASDVQKSHEYFTSDENKSVFRFAFRNIKEVKVHSKYHLSLIYEKFALDNLPNLVLFKILKKQGDEFIGAGDFQVISNKALEVVIENREKRKRLTFKVVRDETTLALKLLKKEIDLSISEMSPRKLSWLMENNKNLNFLESESTLYKYINFNFKKEVFQDLRVRKALALLIPRQEIIKYKLKNTAVLSTGVFSKAFGTYHRENSEIRYNLKEAKKLLDEAGLRPDKDGIRMQLDWKVSNSKASLELVNVIKHYMAKAGVLINIITQEWGTFMSSIKTGNFDIYMGQWIGFTGPEFLNFIFTKESFPPKGGNRGYFYDQNIDTLLTKAEITANNEKRRNLYNDAIDLLAKNLPYINLWHPKIIWVSQRCVKPFVPYPNGSFVALREIDFSCEELLPR